MTDRFRAAAAVLIPKAPPQQPPKPPAALSPCCVFVQAVLGAVYGDGVVARAPLPLWRVWPEAHDAFGPLTAALDVGIADGPMTSPYGGRWLLFQSWHLAGDVDRVNAGKLPIGKGHTYLAWLSPIRDGAGRIIDSAENRGARDELIGAATWPAWFGQFEVTRCVALAS